MPRDLDQECHASQFTHLTVLGYAGPAATKGHHLWRCRCKCGKVFLAIENNLRRRKDATCGCARRRKGEGAAHYIHGGFNRPEWYIWQSMKQRCSNSKQRGFKDYGGRGIRVCKRWLNSFANFFADMGPRPSPKHTLERKEVNGHYQPSNCCWALRKSQMNNMRTNHRITLNGVRMTLSQWAEHAEIPAASLSRRLGLGWPLTKALSVPIRRVNRQFAYDGETMTVPEWAKKVKVPKQRIWYRLKLGWTFERALLAPSRREEWNKGQKRLG